MKRRKASIDCGEGESSSFGLKEEPFEDGHGSSLCLGVVERPMCLVREVNQMPTEKQEAAVKAVVGIQNLEDVPLSLIDTLWEEVEKLEEKSAWDLAMMMNSNYARSPKLGMAFLRSVEGKPRQAAKRLARHFQVKMDLFGREKLVKDIELSDFDEDDMEALNSGGFQVLPAKDRAGRPILFGRYTLMKYRNVKNMVRALWYIWNSMVEEEHHQISGVVAIGFENGKVPLERLEESEISMFDILGADGGFDRDLAREILKIPLAVPIRPMGYHICADNTQWQSVFDMVMVTLCKFARMRIRLHYGTQQETMYAMMTNGIPVDAIPVMPSGEVDLTAHYAWIQDRLHIEEQRRREKTEMIE